MQDVSLRPAPVDAEEASAMLRELRMYPLLTGFRGAPARDIPAMAALVARVSQFTEMLNANNLTLDLNPVALLRAGEGLRCVDALITPAVAAGD